MTDFPTRKCLRLKGYDYSQNGAYFVTICTHDKAHLFGRIVGQGLCSCRLSPIGQLIEKEWHSLSDRYPNVRFEAFVVMPNHIHGIIVIDNKESPRQEQSPCPTVSLDSILCAYKSITTKSCNRMDAVSGRKIWQYRYHDHIIRNAEDYSRIFEYINSNPAKWADDRYFAAS